MATSDRPPKRHRKGRQRGGPQTARGMEIASQNACKHGILSKRLLLSDEDPKDFDALLNGLIASFKPIGTPECMIVEKIAINFWRQRRLVAAEAASIELDRTMEVNKVFLPSKSTTDPTDAGALLQLDGAPKIAINEEQFLTEYNKIYTQKQNMTAGLVQQMAGTIWTNLLSARLEKTLAPSNPNQPDPAKFIDDTPDQFWRWADDLANRIKAKMENIKKLQEKLKSAYTLPIFDQKFYRYEVMLDRELYNALNALMILQGERFNGGAVYALTSRTKRPRMPKSS